MEAWARVFRLARAQHGVVSLRQVRDAGIAKATWQRRLTGEGWHRPFRGVAIVPGAPPSFPQRVMAAVLAVGAPVVAGHRTAGHLLGFVDREPGDIDLVVPDGRRTSTLPGVRMYRTSTMRRRDQVAVGPIPVTAPARALCDLAGDLSDASELRPVVIAAIQRRRITLPRLAARVNELGQFKGSGRLRTVLAQFDEERCDSELEYLVRRRLRAHGFAPAPGPVPVALRTGRVVHVDIGFPPAAVGIEVDGRVYHQDADDVASDHRKHNELQALAYRLLRLTWTRFDRDWDAFVDELRTTLAAG